MAPLAGRHVFFKKEIVMLSPSAGSGQALSKYDNQIKLMSHFDKLNVTMFFIYQKNVTLSILSLSKDEGRQLSASRT